MKHFYYLLLFFFCLNNSFAKESFLPPTATITGGTTVCQNATSPIITFVGSGGVAPYTFTYTINGVTQTNIVTVSGNTVTLPAVTTVVGTFVFALVSVKDSTNATQNQTGSTVVIVNSSPTIDFTFNNDAACSGTAIQFTSSVSGSGPITYSWNFGDGTPVSNLQNPSHSFVSLGCGNATFNVILTVTTTNCTITKSRIVNVKQKPDISFSDILNPFDAFSNCSNASSNPVYSITVGNTSISTCISSYSINWGDGNVENNVVFPKSHTYSQIGAYSMVITAIGTNGCSNKQTYIIKNVSNPLGGLNSPGSTQNLCAPTSNLQFSISNWGANSLDTTYTIDYGDQSPLLVLTQIQLVASSYYSNSNPSSSSNYPIPHTYTTSSCPSTSFQVSLLVTNACGTTPFTLGNISILTKPIANFTAPTIGCVNTSILFTNTTTAGYGQGCTQNSIYTWNFGDGSPIITTPISLPQNINHTYTLPGIYTVTLTAQNLCGTTIKTLQICIEPPLNPLFDLNTNSGCIPLAVTANNTTPTTNGCTPPTYVWNVTYASGNCGTSITPIPNQTTTNASYNFTEAGTYTIKLTATNSCGSFNTTKTVTVKRPPTISAVTGVNTNYCGPTIINPVATINTCTPTTGSLTYAWSFPGASVTSSTAQSPGPINYTSSGTYTITLIVTNECGASTPFTKTFTINDSPTLTTTPLAQTICSGTATTPINLTANLVGTTFTWTATATTGISGFVASGSTNTIPSQTITTASSSAGTLTYVITPSLNGCIGPPTNYVITVNTGPSITTQPSSSTVCLGGTATNLMIVLNNTTGNPTYQWFSNATNSTTTGTAISGATNSTYLPTTATVGTTYYYCIITLTSGGCSNLTSNISSVTVVNSATITTQPIASQNLCVGATIASPLTVSYTGGTGTPSYQWYSNSTNSTSGGTLITGATNATYTPPVFTAAGSYFYYVIVTLSGNSCGNLTTSIAEIVVNDDPTIVTQPLNSQTVCQNALPIDLEVMQTAGSGTFSYQWYSNSVNNTTGGTSIFGATNSIYTPPTTLAGTKYYYCIITQNGATGCGVTSNTAAVIINIAPSFSSQPLSNTICIGQSATPLSVTSANGTGNAQYQWYSNTINSTIGGTAITSANSSTFQPNFSTIGINYYYCIITFPSLSGGCGIITSNIAQVTINPKATISSQNITICSSATFTIAPTNSNGDIVPTGTSYTWSSPIVNPNGSIIGASAQSVPQNEISQTLINTTTLPATVTYTMTPITGFCTGNPFTIIVTVNPSTNPNAIKTDITCFGSNNGAITTNITGGIPFTSGAPYTIVWTGPNGFSSSQPTISGLEPGIYNLSVLDAGGCPISNNYTILEPNDIEIITVINNNITCFGSDNGEIAISVSGGSGPYTFNWTKNGLPFAATEDISNLTPGTYIISVNDANNCGPKTASFIIIEPPVLDVTLVSQTNVSCFDASTGAIIVNAFGGTVTGLYNYLWLGPNGFTSTNQNLLNIPAGTYNLTVTDDLGCNKNLSVIITQSTEIEISYVTTPIVCYGDNNATISVTITGGNTPYQIQWSNLAVGLNQNNLSPGDYTITITDNLGCQKDATINIPSPPIFDVNPVVTNISCFGNNDGSIVLNFVGGIAPVNLVWSDGNPSGITRNNLGPGTYSVTITDSKPCVISRTFTIIEPQPLILSANITNALNCSNANSGAINLLVSGGTPPFNYLWNNGTTTEDLLNISSGNYSVTVTDSRGCTKTAQYSITRPNPIVVTVNTNTTADCDTYTVTQNFAAQVTGGIPPYQLNWSSGTVSGSNNNLMTTTQNGLVVLTAVDAIGCTATYSFNVDIPILGNPSFSTSSIGYNTYEIYSILDPIQFTSILDGNYTSIIWDFGDGTFSNELNPIHTYVNPKNYLVSQTVTYPFGCVYVKYLNLNIEKGYFLVVPTAFSPNNRDGLNDTFRPVTKALKKVQLNIYDTWGSLVYSESGDVIVGWNGKIKGVEAENGNYYAKVIGETFYGTIVMENQTFVLIK